jgi:hypothetical protein
LNTIDVNEVILTNGLYPSVVTDAAIVTVVALDNSKNARLPIVVAPSSI